ncbi:hypothetical protein [uncultured Erythrobacter sp.]|uniref:hypothetical protein n=1 Tax=uncultured Erythrobacter sp. TaxID=263913 RepID=UPI002603DFAD|nr:hypothetical protein [uncultured Erythrobacter sp.]
MSRFPWKALGIDETRDEGAIRKAYADALRKLDLDKDVDGYAQLRRARDEALWLASQDEADDGDYGLGSLDDDLPDLDASNIRFGAGDPVSSESLDWSEVTVESAGSGSFEDGALDHAHVPEEELTETQKRARTAWEGLWDILFPDGEYSDDAITLEQLDDGNASLKTLIEHADQCEISEHDALDHGLAQLFAETWPRSAPFVELAAASFHWLDESGQIEERPALMFLNQRLQGMQFHEEVQQEDHPLNKAWVELSRPGSVTFLGRLKVKRDEIDRLLVGIRESYPEIETFLDGERVASWERAPHSAGPTIVQWFVVILVVVQALRFFAGMDSTPDFDAPLVSAPAQVPAPPDLTEVEINERLSALFGEGTTMRTVSSIDPVFADQLRNIIDMERYDLRTIEGFVRRRAVESGAIAEFDELVALGELKRMWMTVAASQSADMCRNVMAADFESVPLELGDAQRMRERQLLRKMLDAGILSHLGRPEASSFSVPGWAVEETMNRSRLSQSQVSRALSDPNDSLRCQVERTLLGIVLEQPGRISPELLRAL